MPVQWPQLKRRLALAILLSGLATSGCDDNPTTPTPTRIIGLSGNLNFGNVAVGTFAERTLTISSIGNSPLTLSGMILPNGYSSNFAAVTVQQGTTQEFTIRLTPTEPVAYAGIVTVTGDQTSGTSTASITGMGTIGQR